MRRLRIFWRGRGGRAVRRSFVVLAWALGRLLVALIWQLRLLWWRLNPRLRIFLIIFGLVLISGWTRRVAPSVSASAQALAVLLLGLVGFWWILTAPFRRRRWW